MMVSDCRLKDHLGAEGILGSVIIVQAPEAVLLVVNGIEQDAYTPGRVF
ncbi:MAG: hypothetical protein HC880_16860 [Bacteroidia bacterium]|nr:hypothetical protein [Bacteroidia bacterium]